MSINFFKTVKSTLDQTLENYCAATGMPRRKALDVAKRYVRANKNAYFTPGGTLNYQDPLCRMAYLYVYVAAHANLVDNAFWAFGQLRSLEEKHYQSGRTLNVCSLGGGPGSELLGLVKNAERIAVNRCLEVSFTLVDNVTEWDETWNTLRNDIESQFEDDYGSNRGNWPVRISHSFLTLDLCDPTNFQHLPARFASEDIFILNFVVSEMLSSVNQLTDVVRLLADRANSDAYFLFIDRTELNVLRAIESIILDAGLAEIGRMEQRDYMDYDEQKEDLGDWNIDLAWTPKVTLNAHHILASKKPFVGIEEDDIPF